MKRTIIQAVLCGIGTALCGIGAAQAAVPVVQGTGFRLEADTAAGDNAASLITQEGGLARIALTGLGERISSYGASVQGPVPVWSFDSWVTSFGVIVDPGYRITSVALTGAFYGEFEAGQGQVMGYADNTASLRLDVLAGGGTQSGAESQAARLYGTQGISSGVEGIALTGPFTLAIDNRTSAYASSGSSYVWETGETFYSQSRAFIHADGLELAVSISPVPEPQAWLMLAGGLGALALLRRRRQG